MNDNIHPICAELKKCGIRFVANLPERWTANLLDCMCGDPEFQVISVAKEEEGIGICTGLYLGGQRSALLIQNAGFFLTMNALIGLGIRYEIPLLILISQRGTLEDGALYQLPKGPITIRLLDALQLPYYLVEKPEDAWKISSAYRQGQVLLRPTVILLGKEALGSDEEG
ncbi:MAG: sulfopyruvate decarboxylase [Chloroflexi bacterium]|nr:sulfopyruvate decarboxylase [Chloroflexota bacterium]